MFTLAENGYQDTKIAQPTNKHTCSYLNAKVFITTSQAGHRTIMGARDGMISPSSC